MPIWVQPPAFQPVMNIKIDVNSPTWGGLPRWNTDGSKIAMTARVVPPGLGL